MSLPIRNPKPVSQSLAALGPVVSLLAATFLAACGGAPLSQPPVDILVEKEVSDFKVGLRSADSAKALRLYERMDELGVNVVSIALVNEGELRWARSFGDAPAAPPPSSSPADESKTGSFPVPAPNAPVTEITSAVDLGGMVDVPLWLLDQRPNEDENPTDDRMQDEILDPLEMSQSRYDNGRLVSTAEDLSKILTDLQKAHAGKPARRLRQEQVQLTFRTGQFANVAIDSVPPDEPPFELGGTGQARYFARRSITDTHVVQLAGFVFSGHGAVVIADQPDAGVLVDEILSGLAELYDWPAFRAEPAE